MSNLDDLLNKDNFKLKGKSQGVFDFLNLIANTEPIETCPFYWEIQAYLMAVDMVKDEYFVSMSERLN